jgi:hypothetical protein
MTNIFDLSGQSGKKKQPKITPPPSVPKTAITDEEVTETLTKIRSMSQELQDKIQETQKKSGIEDQEIKDYLEGLKRNSPVNYERIIEKKEDLERQLTGISLEQQHKKKMIKKGRKLKGKTLGERKRWLDMR